MRTVGSVRHALGLRCPPGPQAAGALEAVLDRVAQGDPIASGSLCGGGSAPGPCPRLPGGPPDGNALSVCLYLTLRRNPGAPVGPGGGGGVGGWCHSKEKSPRLHPPPPVPRSPACGGVKIIKINKITIR